MLKIVIVFLFFIFFVSSIDISPSLHSLPRILDNPQTCQDCNVFLGYGSIEVHVISIIQNSIPSLSSKRKYFVSIGPYHHLPSSVDDPESFITTNDDICIEGFELNNHIYFRLSQSCPIIGEETNSTLNTHRFLQIQNQPNIAVYPITDQTRRLILDGHYTKGVINILMFRVQFSDTPTPYRIRNVRQIQSDVTRQLNNLYQSESYQQVTINVRILSNIFRVSQTASSVECAPNTQFDTDLRNVINPDDFHVIGVILPTISRRHGADCDGWAGKAELRGRWMWLKYLRLDVVSHELGHTLGFQHAQFISSNQCCSNNNIQSLIRTSEDYGNRWDIMGSANNDLERSFGVWYKACANWFNYGPPHRQSLRLDRLEQNIVIPLRTQQTLSRFAFEMWIHYNSVESSAILFSSGNTRIKHRGINNLVIENNQRIIAAFYFPRTSHRWVHLAFTIGQQESDFNIYFDGIKLPLMNINRHFLSSLSYRLGTSISLVGEKMSAGINEFRLYNFLPTMLQIRKNHQKRCTVPAFQRRTLICAPFSGPSSIYASGSLSVRRPIQINNAIWTQSYVKNSWKEVTENGLYTLYAHDNPHSSHLGYGKLLALNIPMHYQHLVSGVGARNGLFSQNIPFSFWVEYKPNHTWTGRDAHQANPFTNAIWINIAKSRYAHMGSNCGFSYLFDTSAEGGSTYTRDHDRAWSSLPLYRTFVRNGISITPVGQSGITANGHHVKGMQVMVKYFTEAQISSNHPPVCTRFCASTLSIAPQQDVRFELTYSDSDNDAVTIYYDTPRFGFRSISNNVIRINWDHVGRYNVTVFALDFKGGSCTASQTVVVTNSPSAATRVCITGENGYGADRRLGPGEYGLITGPRAYYNCVSHRRVNINQPLSAWMEYRMPSGETLILSPMLHNGVNRRCNRRRQNCYSTSGPDTNGVFTIRFRQVGNYRVGVSGRWRGHEDPRFSGGDWTIGQMNLDVEVIRGTNQPEGVFCQNIDTFEDDPMPAPTTVPR